MKWRDTRISKLCVCRCMCKCHITSSCRATKHECLMWRSAWNYVSDQAMFCEQSLLCELWLVPLIDHPFPKKTITYHLFTQHVVIQCLLAFSFFSFVAYREAFFYSDPSSLFFLKTKQRIHLLPILCLKAGYMVTPKSSKLISFHGEGGILWQ